MADPLTLATIAIYRVVAKELLPTPSKSHYLFNTRDLAKIIQGMMQATKTYYNSKDEVRGGKEAGARVRHVNAMSLVLMPETLLLPR